MDFIILLMNFRLGMCILMVIVEICMLCVVRFDSIGGTFMHGLVNCVDMA